jgi:hypothetical protein
VNHMMRLKPLIDTGAQSWLTCRITEQCTLQNPKVAMASRRSTGVRTSFGNNYCPFHKTKQTTIEAQLSALQLSNHHAVTCPDTDLQNTLHKDMVYAVVDVMQQCNICGLFTREDTTCLMVLEYYTEKNSTIYSIGNTAPVGAARTATAPNIRDTLSTIDVSVRLTPVC